MHMIWFDCFGCQMHKKVCHLSAHLILTDFLIYINIKVLPYLKISNLICAVCCTTAVV